MRKQGVIIKRFPIKEFKRDGEYLICEKYDIVKSIELKQVDSLWVTRERYFISMIDYNSTEELELVKYTENSSQYWKNLEDTSLDFSDIWIPHYGSSCSVNFNRKEITNGLIKIYTKNGENNSFLRFKLSFNGISDLEAKSLIAFNEFNSTKINYFTFSPPPPYCIKGNFKIESFSHKEERFDENSITIEIVQYFGFSQDLQKIYEKLESYLR